jgi:hypothetical protein
MKSRWYILENGLPKAVDQMTWSDWCAAHPNRDVKRTKIEGTDIQVVTVFFCLPEIDFEVLNEATGEIREFLWFYGTGVLGGAMNHHEDKYVSREAAEDGHEKILARVKAVHEGRIGIPECCKPFDPKLKAE